MDPVSERRRAVLFLALGATLWSTGGMMIKSIDWQPVSILSARSIFAAALLLVYLRRFPTQLTPWKIIAAVAHAMTAFLFITSTKLTTAANAIFLQYTAPVYIIILGAWFLKERPTHTDWASMLIIFAGMALFFGDRLSTSGLTGNILAVLSGLTMAVMTVALRAQKNGSPADSILLGAIAVAILGFPSAMRETWTPKNLLIIAYLGIFQIGLAFIFFTAAIKHVPAIEATLIGTLEPVLNPVWVFLFIGEKPGHFALLGGLIVLGGVVLNGMGSTRAAAEPAPPV